MLLLSSGHASTALGLLILQEIEAEHGKESPVESSKLDGKKINQSLGVQAVNQSRQFGVCLEQL